MFILCKFLLTNDNLHSIPAAVRKTIKPIPVIDQVIENGVATMITIVSAGSNVVFGVV